MDKDKSNARQACYRAKKARIEILGSQTLKEQFRSLTTLEHVTNAEKLRLLCEYWEEQFVSDSEKSKVSGKPLVQDAPALFDELDPIAELDSIVKSLTAEP